MNAELFDVVAFTTASTNRPFYRRDALNALSYPRDWLLTLTYRKKWVEPGLWEDAYSKWVGPFGADFGSRLRLRRALVVLCVDPSETKAEIYGGFIPLRFGEVRYAGIVGGRNGEQGILVVRLRLLERPSGTLVTAFPGPFATLLTLPTPKPESHYFVRTRRPTNGVTAEIANALTGEYEWADHVQHIRDNALGLKNCRYVRLHGLRSLGASGERGPLAKVEPGESSRLTAVTFRAGMRYEANFQVDQSIVKAWQQPPLDVKLVGSQMEVSAPVATQLGAAVGVYYIVAPQRQYSPETVAVIVRTRTDDGGITPAGDGPEFQFLARIQPPPLFWLWTIGSAAIGVMLANFSKEALTSLGLPSSDLYLLAFRLIGGLLVAGAAFYALRRLPTFI